MPLNKNIIQDKELSIQIFKDGFSFCTPNARPFFKFETTASSKERPSKNYWNPILFSKVKKLKEYTSIKRPPLFPKHSTTQPKKKPTSISMFPWRKVGTLPKKKHKTGRSKFFILLTCK
jgi:hypothetical protein